MGPRRVRMLVVSVIAAAFVFAALTGCSATAAPVALKVAVFQLRSDYAARGAQIEITNASATDLQVTSATFASSWFARTASSPSAPNQLLAKSTTDFRIALPAPLCSARSAASAHPVVRVAYTRPDGSRGETVVVPTIPFHSIAVVHAQDCARVDFEKVARISIATTLRFDAPAADSPAGDSPAGDGRRAALVDVTFTPTGATGSVTLNTTEDTTLLAQREGTLRRIDVTMSAASPPTTITLDYVPASCLEHRVAEDKIGTLIPMRVDVGAARDALFSVPVPAALKSELLDWVGVYCGW